MLEKQLDKVKNFYFKRQVESLYLSKKQYANPSHLKKIFQNSFPKKISYPFTFDSELIQLAKNNVESQSIIEAADKVIAGEFKFFDFKTLKLAFPIDWKYEPFVNHKWQDDIYSKMEYKYLPSKPDASLTWYLARFNFAINLAQAYAFTKDDKYAKCYKNLFISFAETNSFPIGINWISPQEVAIRTLNLVMSFGLLLDSPEIDDNFYKTFVKYLVESAAYLENVFTNDDFPPLHKVISLVALLSIGIVFADFSYGKHLISHSQYQIEKKLYGLVYSEGYNKEHSFPMQIKYIETFYLAHIILSKANLTFTEKYFDYLYEMFSVAKKLLRKDRTIAAIGDNSETRLLSFSNYFSKYNYDYIFEFGAYIFEEVDFKLTESASLDLLFLCGNNATTKFNGLRKGNINLHSFGLQESGIYAFINNDMNLFIDGGNIGYSHNDTFTYELMYKDKLFIVDSGTFSFYSDENIRKILRSVNRHNTVYVDNERLAFFKNIYEVKKDITKPEVKNFKINSKEEDLELQHYAYTRLMSPVVCKRKYNYKKDRNKIVITDEIVGGSSHQINLNLHFHPEVKISVINDYEYLLENQDAKIKIAIDVTSDNFAIKLNDTNYSDSFGSLKESKKLSLMINDVLPQEIRTEIELL